MAFNSIFKLTEPRVRRLDLAGVVSIRQLFMILEAVNLRAKIELEPWEAPAPPEPTP